MPDVIYILWLPLVIAGMSVAWVLALGLVGGSTPVRDERAAMELGGAGALPAGRGSGEGRSPL